MKKFVSLFLILATLTVITPISASSDNQVHASMSPFEVMTAAYRFLSINEDGENIWQLATDVKDFLELYDLDGNIRAYYISFNPTGFIVINNNIENPIAIEYSKGNNPYFDDDKRKAHTTEKNVYIGVMSLIPSIELPRSIPPQNNIYVKINNFYKLLNTPNIDEVLFQKMIIDQILKKNKAESLQNLAKASIYDSFSMIKTANLNGTGGSTTQRLADIYDISNWGTTSEFYNPPTVDNHCVSTAAFNLYLYYRYSLFGVTLTGTARNGVFNNIHGYIGNGPQTLGDMANGLTSYFSNIYGFNFYDSYGGINYNTFKSGIAQNKIGVYTLFGGFNYGFHTVLGVGWREYTSSNSKYINIVNGWDNSIDYWIVAGSDWGSYQMWCTN